MSCKIERIVGGEDKVVLRVSGRLTGEHVDALRELILLEEAVAIDLTEVMLVNLEAVYLLAASEANGIELRNCPSYIREWVASEKDRKTGKTSSPDGGQTK